MEGQLSGGVAVGRPADSLRRVLWVSGDCSSTTYPAFLTELHAVRGPAGVGTKGAQGLRMKPHMEFCGPPCPVPQPHSYHPSGHWTPVPSPLGFLGCGFCCMDAKPGHFHPPPSDTTLPPWVSSSRLVPLPLGWPLPSVHPMANIAHLGWSWLCPPSPFGAVSALHASHSQQHPSRLVLLSMEQGRLQRPPLGNHPSIHSGPVPASELLP